MCGHMLGQAWRSCKLIASDMQMRPISILPLPVLSKVPKSFKLVQIDLEQSLSYTKFPTVMSAAEILQLPPDALKQIPAASAPPGITSNLINPYDRGWVLVVVSTIFLAIGLIAFLVRLFAKVFIIKKLFWDDRMPSLIAHKDLTNHGASDPFPRTSTCSQMPY